MVCSLIENVVQVDLQRVYCKQTLKDASSRGKTSSSAQTMTCSGDIFTIECSSLVQ